MNRFISLRLVLLLGALSLPLAGCVDSFFGDSDGYDVCEEFPEECN